MKTFPNATNLRLVVDSQRLVSAHLTPFAARIDDRLAQRWTERADTYSAIQQQLREVGGLLGKGGPAAAEASNAVARMRSIPQDTIVEPRVLSGFQLLFNRLDHRIADVIEDGVERGAFLRRVPLPRLVDGGGQLVHPVRERLVSVSSATDLAVVHPVRERFVSVTTATDLAVVRTIRERLRPRQPLLSATPGPTRVDLHSALIHRPTTRTSVERPHL